MADSAEIAVDLGGCESGLANPPFDSDFFSQGGFGDGFDCLDFDFLDDLALPLSEELDIADQQLQSGLEAASDSNVADFTSDWGQLINVFKSTSDEGRHNGNIEFFRDLSGDGSGVLNSTSPGMDSNKISGYLNMQSPESNGSSRDSADYHEGNAKKLNCRPSSESQRSKDLSPNVSETSNNSSARSVISAPLSSKTSILTGVVDQKINGNSSLLKRKKEDEEHVFNTNSESLSERCRKSNCTADSNNGVLTEEDEKRRARLMRNRESAQLSRLRKKHYVEELEDKLKTMHATIQNLNSKISYVIAENASLRQQMSTGTAAAPAVPPPYMALPPPGMYLHPAMVHPWMPYAPPYMVNPQGSQVPLLPIPKLKPQQPAQVPETNKKVERNKNDASKTKQEKESKKVNGHQTKKVASMSLLGLLLFTIFFGCLVPLVNVKYGGMKDSIVGENSYIRGESIRGPHRRVLMLNGKDNSERNRNESQPLAASLYVPRNDKLVKIDGNLIIHSVLATEKAMASSNGLAVPGDLAPAITIPGMGINSVRHSHMRALGSSSADEDGYSAATDRNLQQWFREGLAGPMLTSDICSEVFRFDVATAIVPTTIKTPLNMTERQNSTHLSEEMSTEKDGIQGSANNNSSMVVSVLFDPREAGEADVDGGVMGKKTLSRIFVVVLVDSVRYVTYSCMIPFKGPSSPHLVTA